MKFKTQIESPGRRLCVVSCNGLICLSDTVFPNNVYVCNPLTRQHFHLPESKNEPSFVNEIPQFYRFWCGIGYSRSANLFKVVKFTVNCVKPSERQCSIYTLGVDDEWRILGDSGLPFPRNDFVRNDFVFLNGAFHWIGRENSMWLLRYFDMEKEQVGNLPLPSHFSGCGIDLGVVDNCLYISDERRSSGAFNIWVMKDYKNIESWTLEWIIQRPLPSGLDWSLKPVKTLENGTVLMIVGTKTLASYNPVSAVLERISYHGVKFWEGSIADVLSFLPLPGL